MCLPRVWIRDANMLGDGPRGGRAEAGEDGARTAWGAGTQHRTLITSSCRRAQLRKATYKQPQVQCRSHVTPLSRMLLSASIAAARLAIRV